MSIDEAKTILELEQKHHPECSIFFEALGVAIDALDFQYKHRNELQRMSEEYYHKVQNCIERIEESRGNIPVNRVTDNIIKDYPKELGQLMAYKKSLEIIKEEMGCNE